MTGAPKIRLPPATLTLDQAKHVLMFEGVLWRVYPSSGAHPQAWNALREHGPITGMRFDPHPPPPGHHPGIGVMYTALHPTTALAEVFQETRVIDRAFRGCVLGGWQVTRPLALLDLTGNWPVVNRGVAALQMGSKEHTSAWAHAIHTQFGTTLDGLHHRSSVDNRPMITLFDRSQRVNSFPDRPDFNEPLASAACDEILLQAWDELGYAST